ncbi:MAG: TrmH family RNA methyltransferase [Chitinophagales bacterium]
MVTKARLKHLQSMKLKKYRQNYAEFVIEGDKLTTEALLEKADMLLLAATKKWLADNKIKLPKNIPVEEVSEKELEKISSLKTPPPVVALMKAPVNSIHDIQLSGRWTLVLDGINDPGNLGTIIRSADWFGFKTIVCGKDCVELYNPKVVQSTMGSIFRIGVIYDDIGSFLRKASPKKYAAVLNGIEMTKIKPGKEGILVIGSESHGISKEIIELCDEKISIRSFGKAESLNAAVAASILMNYIAISMR